MKKQMQKRCAALLCAAALTLGTAATWDVSAASLTAKPAEIQVLALGDDCLAEVDGITSAVTYVADYLGGTATNCAEIGQKSTELLQNLKTDKTLQQQIAQSDVILVSIGMNDLIAPLLYEDNDIVDASQYSTLQDLVNGVTSNTSTLSAYVSYLEKEMPVWVEDTSAAVAEAVALIHQQNTSANIIVQTVTNPLAVEVKAWSDSQVSVNRRTAVTMLYYYYKVCIQGGTYNNLTIDTGLNQSIAALPDVSISDFYLPYIGETGEKSLGFYLSNIANLDMTFTQIGQVVEAAYAISADEQLSDGDGSVIAAAYAATGQESELASTRAKLDKTIQSVLGNTTAEVYLGDLNSDGAVDADDAYLTLKAHVNLSVGNPSDMTPRQRRAADADNDGSIDANDAYLWLKYYAQCSVGDETALLDFLNQNGRQ